MGSALTYIDAIPSAFAQVGGLKSLNRLTMARLPECDDSADKFGKFLAEVGQNLISPETSKFRRTPSKHKE